MEKQGTKELEEAVAGVMELALALCKVFKDGAQMSDAIDLYNIIKQPEVSDRLKLAFDGIKNIPAEVRDLDFNEGVLISMNFLEYLPKIMAELGKK